MIRIKLKLLLLLDKVTLTVIKHTHTEVKGANKNSILPSSPFGMLIFQDFQHPSKLKIGKDLVEKEHFLLIMLLSDTYHFHSDSVIKNQSYHPTQVQIRQKDRAPTLATASSNQASHVEWDHKSSVNTGYTFLAQLTKLYSTVFKAMSPQFQISVSIFNLSVHNP